jgi:hypothetical protein
MHWVGMEAAAQTHLRCLGNQYMKQYKNRIPSPLGLQMKYQNLTRRGENLMGISHLRHQERNPHLLLQARGMGK